MRVAVHVIVNYVSIPDVVVGEEYKVITILFLVDERRTGNPFLLIDGVDQSVAIRLDFGFFRRCYRVISGRPVFDGPHKQTRSIRKTLGTVERRFNLNAVGPGLPMEEIAIDFRLAAFVRSEMRKAESV